MSASSIPVATPSEFGPEWLKARSVAAADRLKELDLPSSSEEVWRYSRVEDIDFSRYSLITRPVALNDEMQKRVNEIAAAISHSDLLVIVDGQPCDSEGLDLLEAPLVTSIGPLETEVSPVATSDDVFIVASDANAAFPQLISVSAGGTVGEPVLVINVIQTESAMTFPRTVIKVDPKAKGAMAEVFISADVDALCVPVTEIHMGASSEFSYVGIQNLGLNVTSIARQASVLQEYSKLSMSNVVLGASYGRVRNDTTLVGDSSRSDLTALYFGNDNQMHDFRTLQEHKGRRSESDLFFRGAVSATAHAVYSGLIKIVKGASGTNATQSNRTLKLSPDAVADSVPNLEIDENDVRCAHASAVGPIGADERYYLESRGIPTEDADGLIVRGFFEEVLDRVPLKSAANYARALIDEKWLSQ